MIVIFTVKNALRVPDFKEKYFAIKVKTCEKYFSVIMNKTTKLTVNFNFLILYPSFFCII
ncbi:hypothetical protein MTBBW1_2060003 [Desulfamplus magnetovallimortis]|uniref:Uncharacterized protein n=1 Tax=Desulfamplus magnetovallimortis TaxID=1246637 RepID=A0A1W1HC09_9BACT|nr:hypothetical protein MTBBW1_2060003 [Desulfamplus magnetovallimortis]